MKPAHLGPLYGSQFQDPSVVQAYRFRPPYPSTVFDLLEDIQPQGPRRILELGCGTGDLTVGLRTRSDRIDAIEPSAAMLAVAQTRISPDAPNVQWINSTAEEAQLNGPYTLAIAAESLHWMEWSVVLPKVAASLVPGAVLALVERDHCGLAWDSELRELIQRYSTNREYRPYDLVRELVSRGLFTETGRRTTASKLFVQSLEDHVESIHSRNGFSRDRMTVESAAEFDRLYQRLLERHCRDGIVKLETTATVVWGIPVAA